MTGRLITLEGIDGSGKTTVWERLKDRYDPDVDPVVFTREPTNDTWYGDAAYRSIEDDGADSLAELFLFVADHANHLAETVRPALEQGQVVIADRYIDSRIAYQAATNADRLNGRRAASDFVRQLHEPWTRYPDTTVYLNVEPETGAQRSGETNKMERVEHLETVAATYDRLRSVESERFEVVDSEEQDTDEVFDRVTDIIDPEVKMAANAKPDDW